jgi:uncharacterized membrane protein
MMLLIIGLVIFLGMHSISIFAMPLRNRMAAKSEYGWKATYSIVSLLGLVLLIKGYGDYRLTAPVLYVSPMWLRHVSALLLLPVFILILAPYFPSKINKFIKNPQLTAVKLWAIAHLLVNGSAADLILFGAFMAWAVADVISVKRRPLRAVPHLPESKANLIIVLVAGLALYVVFAGWLHAMLIGVRPFG